MDKDMLQFMMNLEANLDRLYKEHGARQCTMCDEIKINCFPFFITGIPYCADCEDLTPEGGVN
ncbi:late competence protein required for DNA uptake (superfamily II DNA/RNA helicase) [Paenibacillus phyllosphaerae]|uniref:Late competence protein required for DNA uptake (Superfamily II DNA/RNA helicase) n=1 Tax=Paenibacillus phyllosphaerae TaxID=274593 RepID=A0A7W5B045_9BACL|nr:late competence protein required for DNA uptake (superfamily II DNA/RNA helicase) [Paenibacillus phyllosphaerae]